jgi:hydrocephalus-inducing protein
VEFDRLLLDKKLTKTLTLKNICAIPVKWNLKGIAELPEEFEVSKTNGTIKPCKEEVIEITFTAKKEQKFNPKVILEVEDTEGYNIRQDNKTIEFKAEAFKIALDIKMSHDQILDFDAVRVGEPKENKISLKNIGMYPVKYSFTMKKKQTREIFTIEPMEGELNPTEEKSIVVKFMSQKEIKLRTTKNTSDIVLNILEGKTQDTHNSIPINVNVNAVFSKYSITPLKNINFGPMQYGEQSLRSFEVRNEGLFEFKFALCDFKDEEAKKKIRDERQKEIEERIKGLEDKKEEAKDAKGKKPEPAKAAPKGKDAKGAKDAPPEGGLIEVSQYSITPAMGSIPPGSAAVVSVTFKAKGAKFYESTLALDVSSRDPIDQPNGIPFEVCAESSIPGINTEDWDHIFEE